jgi:hypothetical protein
MAQGHISLSAVHVSHAVTGGQHSGMHSSHILGSLLMVDYPFFLVGVHAHLHAARENRIKQVSSFYLINYFS